MECRTCRGCAGQVKTQYATFEECELASGERLAPVTLAYETYGTLNAERSNAILVCHALSGDAHVAGWHGPGDRRPGWWNALVGPGRGLDTDRYCVICSNVLGGCSGSTGPSTARPGTDAPYGLDFPVVTIQDMVAAQARLLDALGIQQLHAVVGGSMGGMQALQWTVAFPDRVRHAVAIATAHCLTPQEIAFNYVGRQAILRDPGWQDGRYPGTGSIPKDGLAVARMMAHITYLSEEKMRQKFGWRLRDDPPGLRGPLAREFEVERYLAARGQSFVERFDALSYVYLTKALDLFHLGIQGEELRRLLAGHPWPEDTPEDPDQEAREDWERLCASLARSHARFLILSISSDWLFPTRRSQRIVAALQATGRDVSFIEKQSDAGHDAFLVQAEIPWFVSVISDFLDAPAQEETAALRGDLQQVASLVPEGSRVLDLGCGDGALLAWLRGEKAVTGQGIDRDEEALKACLRRGIPAVQADVDDGLAPYGDRAFDVVVLSHSLTQMRRPPDVLREAARVGQQVIIAFPNYGQEAFVRALLDTGRTPPSPVQHQPWHESADIHRFTIGDFEALCREEGLVVERRLLLGFPGWEMLAPGADRDAAYAIYQVRRPDAV